MEKINYYEILGIGESATQDHIKNAYRKKAQDLHPDRNRENENAHDEFIQIKLAYDVLKDPEKRAEFDKYGWVDPAKKNTRERAIDSLISLFVSTVETSQSVDHADIKSKMLLWIEANLGKLEVQRQELLGRLPKYKSALKRIKSKNPVFANSMQEKIDNIQNSLKAIDNAEKVKHMMIELLDEDFEYVFDEDEVRAAQHAAAHRFYIGTPFG